MSGINIGNLSELHFNEVTCSAAKHPGTVSTYLRTACAVLALALPACLAAQTHFCIGGDIQDLTPAKTAACQQKMVAVRSAVMQHGAPADWHFVIVCDDEGWKEYASFSGQDTARIEHASYSTDPRLRWTFLRATDLDLANPESAAAMLDTALDGLPRQKPAPGQSPAEKASRRLNIAMAAQGDPKIPQ